MPLRKIDYPNTGGPSKLQDSDPGVNSRVETGAVQFGDDWPGLFIRGDEAMGLAHAIGTIADWFKKLPEEVRAQSGGIVLTMNELSGYGQLIQDEVIVK